MNLTELKQAVADNTGRTDKDSVAERGLQFALDESLSRHDFRDFKEEVDLTTTADQAYVDLPDDLYNLLEVRVVDDSNDAFDRVIKVRHKVWLTRRFPNKTKESNDKPAWAYEEGQRLYFIPIPDDEYTIRLTYYRMPDVSSDAEAVRLLSRALVAYATSYVFQSIEKHQDAQLWQQRFELELRNTIRSDKRTKAMEHYPVDEVEPVQEYWKDPFKFRTP